MSKLGDSNWKFTYFKPDRPGIFPVSEGVCFAVSLPADEMQGEPDAGLILYDQRGGSSRFPFSAEGRAGSLYGIEIQGKGLVGLKYEYYVGEKRFIDPYAEGIYGFETWGKAEKGKRIPSGRIICREFDWQGDAPLMIPYEDSIIYGLNVRGFTMHKSSGVKHKGTFEGIVEKLPYLTKLGITAVELMPAYEYEECMHADSSEALSMEDMVKNAAQSTEEIRLNCWGFQEGFYFSPKASYSAGKAPENSFKTMVRELHKNGIEVIMQFYFPPKTGQLYVLEVIRHWVKEYHIDGVRISGFSMPFGLLKEDPFLRHTKLWFPYLPEEITSQESAAFRNFARDGKDFCSDIRRFLKGDEGLIEKVLFYQRRNPAGYGVINYLADYDGFSLYDCVSYERKHNEANKEDNRDGTDQNFSWNCGTEGETRRKAIKDLRLKQIKNALTFLILSQGTPFLFSGDELANTRYGNNNAYCQDNETGWIKWRENKFTKEIYDYTRFLIGLRREHRILHMPSEFRIMDPLGYGYPDISYHGAEAWRPDLSYISRMAGLIMCGKYAEGDNSFYLAFNMHWEPHHMGLPKLAKENVWVKTADTALCIEEQNPALPEEAEQESGIQIKARSIVIYRTELAKQKAIKNKPRPKKKDGGTDDGNKT